MNGDNNDTLVVSAEDMARACMSHWRDTRKKEGWDCFPEPIQQLLYAAFYKGFLASMKVGNELISGMIDIDEQTNMQS